MHSKISLWLIQFLVFFPPMPGADSVAACPGDSSSLPHFKPSIILHVKIFLLPPFIPMHPSPLV